MDSSIPALILGAILLLGATLVARSSIMTYDRLGQQIKAIEARTGDQARTELTVTDVAVDGPRDTLTVQIRNDGQTGVSAWQALDVIVSYHTGPSTRVTSWFAYAEAGPLDGEWTVDSIQPDAFEPGILNPGETATLTVELSPAAAAGQTHQFILTTDNGINATALFTK